MLTKIVPRVASIELIKSSFESVEIGERNSQLHRVFKSLPYALPKVKFLEKSKTTRHKYSVSFTSRALESSDQRQAEVQRRLFQTQFLMLYNLRITTGLRFLDQKFPKPYELERRVRRTISNIFPVTLPVSKSSGEVLS